MSIPASASLAQRGAVQLAAALVCEETTTALDERVLFACFDGALTAAAADEGLSRRSAAQRQPRRQLRLVHQLLVDVGVHRPAQAAVTHV